MCVCVCMQLEMVVATLINYINSNSFTIALKCTKAFRVQFVVASFPCLLLDNWHTFFLQ